MAQASQAQIFQLAQAGIATHMIPDQTGVDPVFAMARARDMPDVEFAALFEKETLVLGCPNGLPDDLAPLAQPIDLSAFEEAVAQTSDTEENPDLGNTTQKKIALLADRIASLMPVPAGQMPDGPALAALLEETQQRHDALLSRLSDLQDAMQQPLNAATDAPDLATALAEMQQSLATQSEAQHTALVQLVTEGLSALQQSQPAAGDGDLAEVKEALSQVQAELADLTNRPAPMLDLTAQRKSFASFGTALAGTILRFEALAERIEQGNANPLPASEDVTTAPPDPAVEATEQQDAETIQEAHSTDPDSFPDITEDTAPIDTAEVEPDTDPQDPFQDAAEEITPDADLDTAEPTGDTPANDTLAAVDETSAEDVALQDHAEDTPAPDLGLDDVMPPDDTLTDPEQQIAADSLDASPEPPARPDSADPDASAPEPQQDPEDDSTPAPDPASDDLTTPQAEDTMTASETVLQATSVQDLTPDESLIGAAPGELDAPATPTAAAAQPQITLDDLRSLFAELIATQARDGAMPPPQQAPTPDPNLPNH